MSEDHPPNLMRRLSERRRVRRLWGAVAKGLMPPPPRDFAAFGAGSMIVPPSRIESPERIWIGERVMLHEHAWFIVRQEPDLPPPRLVIGSGTSINRFVKIVCIGEVSIGEECLVGDNVYIADTHYRFEDSTRPIAEQGLAPPKPVVIGNGCHIGVRVMIQPGVTLGDNAYVGAGAVVVEDVPPRSVVVGDPARVVRSYDPASGAWVPGDAGVRP